LLRIVEDHLIQSLLEAEDQAAVSLSEARTYRELACLALAGWHEDLLRFRRLDERLKAYEAMHVDPWSAGDSDGD
jgi:hypothetical protein